MTQKISPSRQRDRQSRTPQQSPEDRTQAASPRTVAMTWPVLGLLLVLVFVCGLLAGTMLTQHQSQPQVVHVAQTPAQAPQNAAQPQVRQQPAIPAETQARIAELEREVVQNPKNRAAMVSLANLYFDTHQVQQAIQAYENALAMDRKDANVLTDLGVMYREAHNHEKALACFVEAQTIEPGHMVAMFNQGVVLNYDLHKHDDAIRVWEELVRLHPDATAPNGLPVRDLIAQVRQSQAK